LDKAVPTLLAYAEGKKHPEAVRQEALIALRFAAGQKASAARIAAKLLGLADKAAPAIARTALYTIASVELPPAAAGALGKLAGHADGERARLAIERLAHMT